MFLPIELQELLQQATSCEIVVDNATCLPLSESLTEQSRQSCNGPPPLCAYRGKKGATAIRRRRRRRMDPTFTPPPVQCRWDASCSSPVKNMSNLSSTSSGSKTGSSAQRLRMQTLMEACSGMGGGAGLGVSPFAPSLPLACTNSVPLKMPVRRGSIDHESNVDSLEKVQMKDLLSSLSTPTLTTTIRDHHLQRLKEGKTVSIGENGNNDNININTAMNVMHQERRHSFEKCAHSANGRNSRRVDTARVLDEALSLLNLGL
jgi:hypothetical protein